MNKFALIGLASALALGTVAFNDPLADLGLDLGNDAAGGGEAAIVPADAPVVTTATGEKVAREEVNIGELVFEEVEFIPAQKRGGASGSKYEFDKLPAPVAKEDGTGFKYATFTANLQPGVDADKLKRSVQSATTAENRAAKEAGLPNYYVTRQKIVAGEFAGITVFRVDATTAKEEAAA